MSSALWTPAEFQESTEQGLRCLLCPFECVLHDGQEGRCLVRRNQGGRMETLTRSTAVRHWTPIERKPFYHFHPGMNVLTLASPGCNWTCHYCQNYRVSQYGRDGDSNHDNGNSLPLEQVHAPSLVAEASRAKAAIALSYTEPTMAAELTLEFAAAVEALPLEPGMHRPMLLWKTNGFITRTALRRIAPCLAAVNIDLKSANEQSHLSLTGAPLGPVLDAIEGFLEYGVWVELSTPLIPGLNSSREEIDRLVRLVKRFGNETPWHLLRFTPEFRMRQLAPTPVADLATAVAMGRESGLKYVYVEKALGPSGCNTNCAYCPTLLVNRETSPLQSSIIEGRCPNCQAKIPGHWKTA